MENKLRGGFGPFKAKLTFEERCGFFYAHRVGTPRPAIQLATGLNRGTVLKLTSRKYRNYIEVHLKFDELGPAEFSARYWTAPIRARCAAAMTALARAGGPCTTPGALAPAGVGAGRAPGGDGDGV